MTGKLVLLTALLLAALDVVARTAHADVDAVGVVVQADPYDYSWSDPNLRTGIGVSLMAGGGALGFTKSSTNDIVGKSALWSVRALAGTNTPLGFEVGYTGSTRSGFSSAAVDAVVRWNILPHWHFCPFIFAGLGWQHFKVDDELAMRGMRISVDNDVDTTSVPIGGGLAYRHPSGFVAEVRGTIRPLDNPSSLENTDISLLSWTVSGSVGYLL